MSAPLKDNPAPADRPFWDDLELAERYRTHRATIWRWAAIGKFPKPVKIGPGTTRWKGCDVAAFEAGRTA